MNFFTGKKIRKKILFHEKFISIQNVMNTRAIPDKKCLNK